MYRSFTIKNFRNFEELTLPELKRVNLFAGKNNVGKTALLEAIYFHSGAFKEAIELRMGDFAYGNRLDAVFNQFDVSKEINLSGEGQPFDYRALSVTDVEYPRGQKSLKVLCSGSQSAEILLLFNTTGMVTVGNDYSSLTLNSVFLGANTRITQAEATQRYSQLEFEGKQDTFLNALRVIEPQLTRVSILVVNGLSLIHGYVDSLSRPIPLALMGDGITRIANIVLAIATAHNGVVFVDEIENGIHYSTMPDVWRVIDKAAELSNTQIFATTHSFECINAAHEAFKQTDDYNLQLYRLERIDDMGGIRAVQFKQRTLETAINANFEVR